MYSELGFITEHKVSNLLSIAHLFPPTKRCGIYLLQFDKDEYYIGRAVDVARRFNQHRKNHPDIQSISFIPVSAKKQAEVEKSLIRKAESLGLRLRNKEEVSVTYADCDLDDIITLTEQEHWLKMNEYPIDEYRIQSDIIDFQRIRFAQNYRKFLLYPEASNVIQLLKQYVFSTIPFANRTEMSFWSVSCLPSTNANSYPRLFVVNMAMMECFVFGHQRKSKEEHWGFIVTAPSVLEEKYDSITAFERAHQGATLRQSNYRAAGQDQISIAFESIDTAQELLTDTIVVSSIKEFNLGIMRKRPNIYSKYHCFDLADQIL